VKRVSEENQQVVLDRRRTYNHLSAALHLLASVRFLSAAFKNHYLASIACVEKNGNSYLPRLVHEFARALFHTGSQSLTEKFLADLARELYLQLPSNATYSFLRFGVGASQQTFLSELLHHLHHYSKYLVFDPSDREHQGDRVVRGKPLALYMDDELAEQSPVQQAFGGKYLVMKRCPGCKHMELDSESFLGLNFRAFTSEDTSHIYSMRKEFGAEMGLTSSLWSVFKPFSYYWATIWDATVEDYLASHLLHDLMQKREEKDFCDECKQEQSFEAVYKLGQLPNHLLLTFRYVEGRMEEHVRLRGFLELDLAKSVQLKFLKQPNNPFAEEEDRGSLKYALKSLVCFEDKQNFDSGYVTYAKSREGAWTKTTKTAVQAVDAKEVEAIVFPYALVYERLWDCEPERRALIEAIKADEGLPDSHKMYAPLTRPIPDLWVQRLKHLHEPGFVTFSHLLTPGLKLRPYYRDVALETYPDMPLDQGELVHLAAYPPLTSNFQPLKTPKKTSSRKESTPAKTLNPSREPYTKYFVQGVSTFLSSKLAERLVRQFCFDVDFADLNAVDFATPCEATVAEQKRLICRRHYELSLVEKLQENEQAGPYFGLPNDWINQWTLYTQYSADDNRVVNRFLFDQFPPPSAIPAADKPEDLSLVPAGLFQAFRELYGCEKVVGRTEARLDSPEADFVGGYLSPELLDLLEKTKAALDSDPTDEEVVRICELEHQRLRDARAADQEEEEEEDEDLPVNQFAGQQQPEEEDEDEAETERPPQPANDAKPAQSRLSQSTMEETTKLVELSEQPPARLQQPKSKDSQL